MPSSQLSSRVARVSRFTRFALALSLVSLGACAPKPAAAPAPAEPSPTVSPEPTPPAPEPVPPPAPTTITFADLGLALTVPPGLRAVGDDELATRVRASASPKTQDLICARVAQKRALPLLTLARSTEAPSTGVGPLADDGLGATLTVTGVPKDARPDELLGEQQRVLAGHVPAFAVETPLQKVTVSGVAGGELAVRYELPGPRGGAARPMRASLRAFVRDGMAFTLTVTRPAGATEATEADARAALEGLAFTTPTPELLRNA